MQMHTLKRNTPRKLFRQRGRGGKRGKTSGRGTKGMLARAGYKRRPEMRDVIKKLPKLRGYAFKSIVAKAYPVSLMQIEQAFKAGAVVTPTTLVEAGVVEKINGTYPTIKILADGDLTKKLSVIDCKVSAGAKAKIEKAGGSVK